MTSPREPELLPGRSAGSLATTLALAAVAAVAALAWSSLLLAQLGRHSLGAVLALTAALSAIAGAALWRHRALARSALRVPPRGGRRAEIVLVAATAAVAAGAAWMFLPGFPFALADRDPGVYLAQAFQIERTGDVALEDPIVDPDSGLAWASAFGWREGEMRFPGFWVLDRELHRVASQFYALYPSLLATAIAAVGPEAAIAVNPLLATLAAALLFLLARSAAGPLAGGLAALLFVAQMFEVWHAKYPTAEIIAQIFVLGAALALAAAIERRSAALGALAGALVALTFLARPDGLLIVALTAAGGIAWTRYGTPGPPGRGLLVGLLALLPHALAQAYLPRFNLAYTLRSGLPGPAGLALAGALALAALWLATRARKRGGRSPGLSTIARHRIALAVLGATTLLLALALLRPSLFGPDLTGDGHRTFNEESLWRLGWFFTPRGLLLFWLGVGWVCLTSLRRRPSSWLLVAPALLLLPVFLYDPRVDAGLMWWTRRFVPYTLPGMVTLAAIGLAGLWAWGARREAVTRQEGESRPPAAARRVVALVALVLAGELILAWSAMSLPLRHHREMRGTLELIDQLGHLAPGRRALLLWHSYRHTHSPGFCFGGPVWVYHDQVSALLPFDVSADEIRRWATAYPDSPLFLLADDEPPPALASLPFALERRFDVALPMWRESVSERPASPRLRHFRFAVWRLDRDVDAMSRAPP